MGADLFRDVCWRDRRKAAPTGGAGVMGVNLFRDVCWMVRHVKWLLPVGLVWWELIYSAMCVAGIAA
ncbi:hypothetical protein D9603_03375 [Pseudoalteromonas sp. PS5]|nr:hypothetical protein D9603_03375 [Pseudoalteromonas sp. PS5]